jgi:hypothetical protein
MNVLDWYLILASSIFPFFSLFFFEQDSCLLSFSLRGMESFLRTIIHGLCLMDVFVYDQSIRMHANLQRQWCLIKLKCK